MSSFEILASKDRPSLSKDLRPAIILDTTDGREVVYFLPAETVIRVSEGETVTAGSVLGRVPQATSGTKDITGGLPRVADLFEARKPKDHAIMAEVSGTVSFGKKPKVKTALSSPMKRVTNTKNSFQNGVKSTSLRASMSSVVRLSLMVHKIHMTSYA